MQINNRSFVSSSIANTQKIEPICMPQTQMVVVGRFGKSVGLKGGIRIAILTDFPKILCQNASFYIPCTQHILPLAHIFNISSINCDKINADLNPINTSYKRNTNISTNSNTLKTSYYFPITLHSFNTDSNVIHFSEVARREEAALLCNTFFYSTIDDTRRLCKLSENEFFYFDIIGMSVVENGVEIGIVQDIQEIANTHYFVLDKHFMIPYIDRYVLNINLTNRQIITQDARFLRT